jgi:hypothetical protein
MQFSDKSDKQAHRLALMVELCDNAGAIALQMLERGEEFDMVTVFEVALQECLKRDNYDKDDLATVWAMLQLGSRAIRRFSLSTDHYNLGPSFDPPALVPGSGEEQSSN